LRSFAVGAAPFSAEATFPLLGERALALLRVWEITVACTSRERTVATVIPVFVALD
jgi:hypothetical protein